MSARTALRKVPSSAPIPIMRTCAFGFKSLIGVTHWRFKAAAPTESNKTTPPSDLAIASAMFERSAGCPITSMSGLCWMIRANDLRVDYVIVTYYELGTGGV